MSSSKEVFLDIAYVYQIRSDTISVQTTDRRIYNLGGNASKYLTVTPPFRKTEDGNLSIPKGYVQLCNSITFHFMGGPLEGKEFSCSLVDGHKLTSESAGTRTTSYNDALQHFAATGGGEPGRTFQIPSPTSLDFYEYEVEKRQVSIRETDSSDFPIFDVVVDVFCRPVGPE